MPKTVEQARIESAARVVTTHSRRGDTYICRCDKDWTPLHLAQMLSAAGCLGVNPKPKYATGGSVSAPPLTTGL